MADYDSSLPIRSEADGADERVHVKVVDGTTPAQMMTVDADGLAHVEVHGNNPAAGDEVLKLSELGDVTPDGVYDATNNSDPGNVGVIAHTRATTPADTDQVKRVTAVSNATHHSLDVALHLGDGSSVSNSNPIPVSMAEGAGTEVHSYTTSAAVAAAASVNHDYTVSAAVSGYLKEIVVSGSGKIKAVFQQETAAGAGTYNTFAVLFNSTATPSVVLPFPVPKVAATGVKYRITITNLDNQAQDVYSTMMLIEAA